MTKLHRALGALIWAKRGTTSIELAFVGLPFVYVLIMILQLGVYYMTQAALDAAVNATANSLRDGFNTASSPTLPTGSALKSTVAANAGALFANNSGLSVDLRTLSSLGGGSVPISDQTVDSVTTSVPIVLRAQAHVVTFAWGFGSLVTVQSAAILRFDGF